MAEEDETAPDALTGGTAVLSDSFARLLGLDLQQLQGDYTEGDILRAKAEDAAARFMGQNDPGNFDPVGFMANLIGGPALKGVGQGIRAYHGSPYDFERFDSRFIGKGEGAQAYGHGLYFAESPAVALDYKNRLWGKDLSLPEYRAALELSQAGGDVETAVRSLHTFRNRLIGNGAVSREVDEAIKILQEGRAQPPGRMYEVNIAAKPEQFLDWDKPLAQQSQEVKEAFGNVSWAAPYLETKNLTGGFVAPKNPEAAAQFRDAGIPGIRYLDQGSRAAGEGSSNYVVFDDSLISILRKYGLAGGLSVEALREMMNPPSEGEDDARGGR